MNQRQQNPNSGFGQWITVAIGGMTILSTVVAAIPAFISLNQSRPEVYYQAQEISVLNPDSPDYENLIIVLKQNQIPDSRLTVKVKNIGDGSAEEVKFGLELDGKIHEITTNPSVAANPAWVDLPNQLNDFKGNSGATFAISNLATTKTLTINVTYLSYKSHREDTKIDIFYNGKPAILIDDIENTPKRTVLYEFRYVIYILGGGLILVLVVSTIIVVNQNKDYLEVISKVLELVVQKAFLFR